MLKRINPILPELMLELGLYGLVIQFAGVWFVEDKLRYSTGLWIGIAVAAGMAINMAVIILDSVELMAEKRATRKAALFSLLRYILVVTVFVLTWYFKLGNLISMFIGVMGLKIAAYLQPLTHKFIMKHTGRGDDSASDQIG